MSYLALKHLHVTCVVLSGLGFSLRGFWMLSDSPWLKARATRIVPHLIDTILLTSALTLAVWSAQYPFVLDWLTMKTIGLVVYVLCGTMALKRGRTKKIRTVFFFLALIVYFYIVSVAITRSPTAHGLGQAIVTRLDALGFF